MHSHVFYDLTGCVGLDGAGVLVTVALRPTVMYGEQDHRFVPGIMKLAHRFDQRIPKLAGAGGKQQLTYVGMYW